jgi:large subunit ribosomal protein L5
MSEKTSPMKELKLEKVVVNIGVGESGDRLTKAQKVLQLVTRQKPVPTRSHATNRDLGIREGQEIGAKVTLRGKKAEEFLRMALATREMQLSQLSLDRRGNFAFGIPDYTDFKGFKYDPAIGIFGMDVCVEVARKGGWGVKHRTRAPRPIGKRARVAPEETKSFLETNFSVVFVE